MRCRLLPLIPAALSKVNFATTLDRIGQLSLVVLVRGGQVARAQSRPYYRL